MAFTQKLINVSFSMGTGAFGGGQATGNAATLTGLRVSLQIAHHCGPSMGELSCVIYGMPLSLMNQLSCVGTDITNQQTNSISIEAGDASGMSLIFTGTISHAFVDATSMPEVGFHVVAHAGAINNFLPATPTSFKGSADVATLMGQLASSMGLGFENNNVSVKVSNPYLPGNYRQQMLGLARMAGIEAYIHKNTLIILPPGQSRSGSTTTMISPQTGMVGYPAFNQAGIIVTTLFVATLEPFTSINVQSDLTPACGTWNIYNMDLTLDSMVPHGRWFAILSASRVNGGGVTAGG